MEIKSEKDICLDYELKNRKVQWVRVDDILDRMSSIMNVRNNEDLMRLKIIDLSLELKNELSQSSPKSEVLIR
jgi:hypothetical protein